MTSFNFQSFLGAAIIYSKLFFKTQINQKESSALALSSLLISSKLYQIRQISVGQISSMTGNKVSKYQILTFQGWIMQKLYFYLFLEPQIQKTFDDVFNQVVKLNDVETLIKVEMLIQLCLLRGNEILTDQKWIKSIGKYVNDEKRDSFQLNSLREYLKGLKNSHKLRSLMLKWSFKIDTDFTVSRLEL